MKKFKFLFLSALVAVMFIGCAQPTDDDTPIISDAQPTVVKAKSFLFYDNDSLIFYKEASVTYSDGRVDKYEITTPPCKPNDNGDYVITCALISTSVSTIDFFNDVPIIISWIDTASSNNNTVQIEFKFSEIYTKVE